ncbi:MULTISPECIES: substrate-binding domain-containing protein [unclassified Nesterenkonia]|uniref:substrate-binding domain-containing protein n=1 Tax=unclassified Nesterenkonia TaxID=2629769 RepID=UPI001F4D2583|nr:MULTISPECIES: substrate-binding domain-containing protein [unclassified Nesterenkonia]MCH8560313.1 substrate-binding domain-containing protein [Nesterenkonia sp. DZ6]MCH8563679.1 substrate-binding domain-containing protein [Nesterenkonia sp. YGD6]
MEKHSHPSARRSTLLRTTAVLGAAALMLTACSEGGGRTEAADTSDRGGGVDTEEQTYYLITHAADGDTFWDYVRAGAEEAAAQKNINLVYNNHVEGAQQAELIQSAIDAGADGIAVTMAKPEAMTPNVQSATEAGIPVVSLNAGEEEAFDAGVLSHFGQDENVAGEALGQRLADEGIEHTICVIQEQGHVGLENRCAGIAEHVPETEILYVEGTDMTQVSSTVEAKLQTTPDADAIVGLGGPFTETILDVVESSGSEIEVASFDLNATIVQAVLDDNLMFAVDQQPWLQGYLSVDTLWLHHYGAFEPGGGLPVLTGPAIIDAENAEAVQSFADEGLR